MPSNYMPSGPGGSRPWGSNLRQPPSDQFFNFPAMGVAGPGAQMGGGPQQQGRGGGGGGSPAAAYPAYASMMNTQLTAPLQYQASLADTYGRMFDTQGRYEANRDNALANIYATDVGGDVARRGQDTTLQGVMANANASEYGSAADLLGDQYQANLGLQGQLAGYGAQRDIAQMGNLQHVMKQQRFQEILPLLAGLLGQVGSGGGGLAQMFQRG